MGTFTSRRGRPEEGDGVKVKTHPGHPLSDPLVAALFQHHRERTPRELEVRLLPMVIKPRVKAKKRTWQEAVIYLPDRSRELLSVASKRKAALAIIQRVAHADGISADDVMSRSQTMPVIRARQRACYLIALETDMTIPAIGKIFGRDHSTILNALDQYCELNDVPPPRKKKGSSSDEARYCRVTVSG